MKKTLIGVTASLLLTAVLFAGEHDKSSAGRAGTQEPKPNEKYLALCDSNGKDSKRVSTAKLDEKTLAAYDLLRNKCASCHNPGSTKGGKSFPDILDRDSLVSHGIIKPGESGASTLIEAVEDGSMPKGGKPLSSEEKKILKEWVSQGAKSFSTKSGDIPEVGFISNNDLESCMVKDIRKVNEEDRPFVRYLNLADLYNGSRRTEIERTQLALNKLLNSLSWKKQIKNPVVIDGTGTLLRIDLRDYRWTPEMWDEVAKVNPYSEPIESAKNKELSEKTETKTPVLRGDWVVFSASKPPLYHTLLALPQKAGDVGADTALEKLLLIDTTQNEKNGDMVRAGFKNSNVVKFNRILDRHDTPFGAYWKSSDFKTNVGKQNIFEHPLDFEKNGGEYIFSLPNHLHGYLLTDAKGGRLDSVPTEIAVDPLRIHKDGAILNGVSCMSCHTRGMRRKDDEILSHGLQIEKLLAKNPNAALEAEVKAIKKLYKGKKVLDEKYSEDEKAYGAAIEKTGNSVEHADPVFAAAQAFEVPLDLHSMAAELGHEKKDLEALLENDVPLRKLLALGATNTVDRDVFNANFRLLKNRLEGKPGGDGAVAGNVSSDPGFDKNFEFVSIKPGTFTMGSPAGEAGRSSDEKQHKVTISKGFDMLTTPVTQGLFEKVTGKNPSRFKGDPNRPVETVSWNDAQDFIKKLNERLKGKGFKYRLPTEAEWEFAARGGTQTAYSFGDDPSKLKEFGWFTDNSKNTTQPVKTLKPNPLGLYDMHGNVWQWMEDAYKEDLGAGAVTDPLNTAGSDRVVRGGGWNDGARFLRSARRNDLGPDVRFSALGFRLVRTPE